MGLAASARDVTLSFDGACNCCNCCDDPPSPNMLVYVTSKGNLEPFSPTKAGRNTKAALKRSVEHLNRHLDHVGHIAFIDPKQLKKQAEKEVGANLDPDIASPIDYGSIEKLNSLFERAIKS